MPEPLFKIVICYVKAEEYNEIHPYLIDEVVSKELNFDDVRKIIENIDSALDREGVDINKAPTGEA